MKALSLHQPRAEQVIRGEKSVDLRSWTVSHRGPLAIHAPAERRDARCRELGFDPATLAYGAILGWVELVDITPLDEAAYEALRPEHRSDDPFPGAPCYAWRFTNPRRLPQPIPCPGRRRLFEVEWEEGREGERGEQESGRAGEQRIEGAEEREVVEWWGDGGDRTMTLPHHDTTSPPHHDTTSPPHYRTTLPPEPDPARPFALYALAEKGGGYRVALYQWLRREDRGRDEERAPGALWSIELGGPPLQSVADHLLAALRANGHRPTDLARTPEAPFLLDEPTGLRLALLFLAVKPLTLLGRIAALGQGIQAMSDEEAYYWFSKCTAGPAAARAQKALRVLLAEE